MSVILDCISNLVTLVNKIIENIQRTEREWENLKLWKFGTKWGNFKLRGKLEGLENLESVKD